MNKIAEKLDIKTTEEEINGYIAQMATGRGQRPEHLRQTMERDGSLAQLTLQIREDKCLAKLLESAKITEVQQKPVSEKKVRKETKKSEAKPPKKEIKAAATKKPAAKTPPQKTDKKETKTRSATKKKAGK